MSSRGPYKLTFEQAEEIRAANSSGTPRARLAVQYGVSEAAISKVVLLKSHSAPRRVPMTREQELASRRSQRLLSEYGLTTQQWEEMLSEANYSCQACGGRLEDQRPHHRTGSPVLVCDHDHDTGEVRGILCSNCNSALGFLGDDENRVRSLLTYIEEHNKKGRNA